MSPHFTSAEYDQVWPSCPNKEKINHLCMAKLYKKGKKSITWVLNLHPRRKIFNIYSSIFLLQNWGQSDQKKKTLNSKRSPSTGRWTSHRCWLLLSTIRKR